MTGLVKRKADLDRSVVVNAIDLNESRIRELSANPDINAFQSLSSDILKETDVLVLAVKPQQADSALGDVNKFGGLRGSSILVSVVAGYPTQKIIEANTGTNCLVRSMPNTPATIGRGCTVWMKSPETTDDQVETTRILLRTSKCAEVVLPRTN